MRPMLLHKVPPSLGASRPMARRPATHVACMAPAWPRRARMLPAVMRASPGAPSSGVPCPGRTPLFFESVARKLSDISRRESPTSGSGQWAGQFASALHQYVHTRRRWEGMSCPALEASACNGARREMAELLQVLVRKSRRVPPDIAAQLGELPRAENEPADMQAIGTWAGVSRALSLSLALLPEACVALQPLQAAPRSDPLASLQRLQALLQIIDTGPIDIPEVQTWRARMRDALTAYDAALERWNTRGPGYGGLNILNALACCKQLLAEEKQLPLSPGIFTHPQGSFASSDRWLNATAQYQLARSKNGVSPCQRVRDFLESRCYALHEAAAPWEAPFT